MKLQAKAKAIEMRKKGFSIPFISTSLNVAKSSVSVWVKDVSLTKEQKVALSERCKKAGCCNGEKVSETARNKRRAWQESGRRLAKIKETDFIAGCMLFWGEGSKTKNNVQLVNSDPNLIRIFLQFLYKYFPVTNNDVIWNVNCRLDCGLSQEQIEKYWEKELKLVPENKRKGTIKSDYYPQKQSVTKLPYGVCSVSVHKKEIAQMLFGAIQEYGNFSCEKWLE